MSQSLRGPLLALGSAVGLTAGAVYTVHVGQKTDKEKMHRAVLKDIEEEEMQRKLACAQAGGPCDARPPQQSRGGA